MRRISQKTHFKGTKGAKLYIQGDLHHWEEGKVIAWDGSFDHSVDCADCEQDRIIIMVRYMHPGVTKEHYGSATCTHFEKIEESMFEEKERPK